MIRIMLLISLFIYPLQIFAQNEGTQMNDSSLESTAIINVPNTSKDAIYIKLSKWVALNYRSANDVIQLSDKDAGAIIVKGIYRNSSWVDVLHTLQIDIKDNKVRVQIGSMVCKYPNAEYPMKKAITGKVFISKRQTQQFKKMMIEKINNTIASIEMQLLAKEEKW